MVANGQGAVGRRLRLRRAELGLTLEELADRTGLSVRAISNIELGRTAQPRRSSVRLLAGVLGHDEPGGTGPVVGLDPPANASMITELVVPRQLPAATRDFVGRAAELSALNCLLDQADGQRGGVAVAAVGGMAGVGKTGLAVQWAHQAAGRFPDGQLYVDLRGFGPSGPPVAPADAVCGFLEALGVPAARIPVRADARLGLYRSLLADKRILVLLDNASDADQVRPLLPGSAGCLALVTSRGQLTGLAVAEGARLVSLDVLSKAEARDLLALRLGAGRLAAEPQAADALVQLTAGLPLALGIAAARAAAHPAYPLAMLAAELQDARGRLQVLDGGDASADVRAAFSWSYRRLSEPAARMFRLLGIHPGPDITAGAAASLAGSTPRAAHRALAELTAGGLVTERVPGRFGCHDLLRSYSAELGQDCDSAAAIQAAGARMLDHYLHTAQTAMLLLTKAGLEPPALAPPRTGVRPEDLRTEAQALAWFSAEHDVLLLVAAAAARTGFDSHAWLLPATMATYLNRVGHWHDSAASLRTALAAAQRLGDQHAQARVHRSLGLALARLRYDQEAYAHLRQALRVYSRLGDQAGQAHTHFSLALLQDLRQRHRQSLHHSRLALRLFQATGDQIGQATALNGVGWDHTQLGDHQQAIECCQQALQLCGELGDHTIAGATWDTLGLAQLRLGRPAEAIDCYYQAIGEYRLAGHRPGEGDSLAHLGDAQCSTGDLNAAAGSWRQALDILSDLRHPDADAVRAKLQPPG